MIYWLSDQAKLPRMGTSGKTSGHLFDYSAHAFTFGVLMLLIWRTLTAKPTVLPCWLVSYSYTSAAMLSALYGASDEIHQGFVPGRTAALSDWLADVVGIAAATAFLMIWQKWWNRHQASRGEETDSSPSQNPGFSDERWVP